MTTPTRPPVEPLTLYVERGELSNTCGDNIPQAQSETSEQGRIHKVREETPPNDRERASKAQNSPVRDALDIELEELEAWREKTVKLQQVEQLRQAQARYLAGNQTALQTVIKGAPMHSSVLNVPTAKLLTPKAPYTFNKRTRLEFNCWTRDCERYFTMMPANFAQEFAKVNFGAQYISETMKSLWQAHCADQKRKSPQ